MISHNCWEVPFTVINSSSDKDDKTYATLTSLRFIYPINERGYHVYMQSNYVRASVVRVGTPLMRHASYGSNQSYRLNAPFYVLSYTGEQKYPQHRHSSIFAKMITKMHGDSRYFRNSYRWCVDV